MTAAAFDAVSEVDELVLGLDIGTSSSKAVLVSPAGDIVASAERPHGLAMVRPGFAEHDAESIWWRDVEALLAELAPLLAWVRAVAVSGIGPCLLPLDEHDLPLRPAILYGIDTRAAQEIDELNDRYGADALIGRGGSPLTTQAVGPKMLWLQHHEPELWKKTRRFVMASSFVLLRLTGEYVLDHHSASQCNPLYDLKAEAWADDLAAEIAPGLVLPRLLWPAEVAGTLSQAAAAATGLTAGIPVVAGTIDAWADAFGAGVARPGETMLSYGTTLFIVHVAEHPHPSPHLWLTAGVAPHTRTVAAGLATSGAVTSWLRELSGGAPFAELLRDAAAVPAGSEGLVVLPYFAGERTPIFDSDARGAILGLTLRHGRGHLYRAVLEGIAYGVRHNLEAITDAGSAPSRLVALGGGTRGALWSQIVSDVTQAEQVLPTTTIGASYGDARLAAQALGIAHEKWNPPGEIVRPDPDVADRYDALYRLYREAYPATRDIAHALAAFQLAH